tara:strand:- start:93 stop:1406 length:1314 start_codon:yes stop_codon:yes gene_type:complete
MPYFPKQSINYRDASPGEFIYKNTQQPYEGPIMETNTGRFYPGSDPNKAEIELIKAESLQSVQFGFNRHTQLYNIQKLPIFEKKKQQLKPGASKIGPSEKDYKRGYYNRFYMYRTNSTSMVTEISEQSYRDILDRKMEIDTNLYKVGQFKWALKGEVAAINFLTLEEESMKVPSIENAFPKLDEFFRVPSSEKGDENKYNIPGRYYPDDDIHPIPSNLPPTYMVIPIEDEKDKKCGNCIFFLNNNCTKWKAAIRQGYWCKSWHPNQSYIDVAFQEFLDEQQRIKEEELRQKREGKLLTGIGKALAEALKARGITDLDGANIENFDEPHPNLPPITRNEKKFRNLGRKSNQGEDRDIRREGFFGRKRKEKEERKKKRELNFDPTQIKKDPSGRQRLAASNLPPGKVVGEILVNKFNKKRYKWDGKQWIPMRNPFRRFK